MGVKPALEGKKHVHANVGNHAANQKFPRKQLISQFRRVIAACKMTLCLKQRKLMPNTLMRPQNRSSYEITTPNLLLNTW